jgi:hypothetical protein
MALLGTRDLAIYASVVGTLNGLWVLFHGVVRDRPRITVRAYRSEAIPVHGGARQQAFSVQVSNRGRRPVNIESIARLDKPVRGIEIHVVELMQQLAQHPRLEESQSQTFHVQRRDLPMSRWFATDGAGRVHPLRERYRQLLLAFILWPVRRLLNWWDRRNA